MIDPKYLDMLKEQPSVAERVSNFLNETIDKLITGAICDVSEQPLPEELGFKEIHLGMHKLNGRKIIVGEMEDDRSVHVEFSADFKKGYVAKRNFIGYEEVVLTPDASNAAKTLFDTVDQKLAAMAYAALPDNPKLTALQKFLSETRYGSNEYLCNEYLDIYTETVLEMLDQIDNEEVKDAVRDPLLKLKVSNIRQFLKDNGIDPNTADVHVID